jgi:hypothetical protein
MLFSVLISKYSQFHLSYSNEFILIFPFWSFNKSTSRSSFILILSFD